MRAHRAAVRGRPQRGRLRPREHAGARLERHAAPGRARRPGLQELSAAKVVLVSLAEDENILPRFRAALAGDGFDVSFAHAVPAGPGIAGLAVAPPIRVTAEHVAALPDLRIVAAAAAGHD